MLALACAINSSAKPDDARTCAKASMENTYPYHCSERLRLLLHAPARNNNRCRLEGKRLRRSRFCQNFSGFRCAGIRNVSMRAEFSAMFFGENMRIEVGNPLLAFLRDPQVPQGVPDIGTNGPPEEGRIVCAQIVGALIAELFIRAGLTEFGKQRRRFA